MDVFPFMFFLNAKERFPAGYTDRDYQKIDIRSEKSCVYRGLPTEQAIQINIGTARAPHHITIGNTNSCRQFPSLKFYSIPVTE